MVSERWESYPDATLLLPVVSERWALKPDATLELLARSWDAPGLPTGPAVAVTSRQTTDCTVAAHAPPPTVSVSVPVAAATTVTRLLLHGGTEMDAAPMVTVMSPPDDAERVTSIWYV